MSHQHKETAETVTVFSEIFLTSVTTKVDIYFHFCAPEHKMCTFIQNYHMTRDRNSKNQPVL